jgi:hypothetical protein
MTQGIIELYNKDNVPLEDFMVDDIKEKYGTLRVNFRSSIHEVHELIE